MGGSRAARNSLASLGAIAQELSSGVTRDWAASSAAFGSSFERTIASIDAELRSIIDAGFTQQEIDESKSYMIGALPRQLETNAAIASFLLSVDMFGLGLDYDQRLPDLIGAVTKDTADAAARRLLDPARATIAVAGPLTAAAS